MVAIFNLKEHLARIKEVETAGFLKVYESFPQHVAPPEQMALSRARDRERSDVVPAFAISDRRKSFLTQFRWGHYNHWVNNAVTYGQSDAHQVPNLIERLYRWNKGNSAKTEPAALPQEGGPIKACGRVGLPGTVQQRESRTGLGRP
jgi:hypothetical protein